MPQIRIAVCDDEDIFRKRIMKSVAQACKAEKVKAEVVPFQSGDDLIQEIVDGSFYNLYLLDIQMPGATGVDVARAVRERYNHLQATIIFVSSHTTYHGDLLQLQPYLFINKLDSQDFVVRSIQDVIRLYRTDLPVYEFQVGKQTHVIHLENLVCLESSGPKIIVHYYERNTHNTVEFYGTLKKEAERLPKPDFCFPHASFIVNFRHAYHVSPRQLVLSNGMDVPVSYLRSRQMMQQYREFRNSHTDD